MKKSQVFSLDILIALVILIIGIAILYYTYPEKTKNVYDTDRLSEDVISTLQSTKIKDLCLNPGTNISYGCSCRNYATLQVLACDERLLNKDENIISLITELIETRRVEEFQINDMIKEIFVTKNVIDEKRYGFAIIYTVPGTNSSIGDHTYELYNTEKQP